MLSCPAMETLRGVFIDGTLAVFTTHLKMTRSNSVFHSYLETWLFNVFLFLDVELKIPLGIHLGRNHGAC